MRQKIIVVILSVVLFVAVILLFAVMLGGEGLINIPLVSNIAKERSASDIQGEVISDDELSNPDGFGVERPIEVPMATPSNAGRKDMSDITWNSNAEDYYISLNGASDELVESVNEVADKEESGVYHLYINWYEDELMTEDIEVILAIIGKIEEDKLNSNGGDYAVRCTIPRPEDLEAAGSPVAFFTDAYGYLTVYGDILVQNLAEGTEVEEIRAWTVYYEGDVLTIKE